MPELFSKATPAESLTLGLFVLGVLCVLVANILSRRIEVGRFVIPAMPKAQRGGTRGVGYLLLGTGMLLLIAATGFRLVPPSDGSSHAELDSTPRDDTPPRQPDPSPPG